MMFFGSKPAPAPVEASPESLRAFLRAGGVVSLREWLDMDESTQATMERAGTAVSAEFALAVAACLAGGHEEIAAMVDGGEAADEEALRLTLNQALRGPGVSHE